MPMPLTWVCKTVLCLSTEVPKPALNLRFRLGPLTRINLGYDLPCSHLILLEPFLRGVLLQRRKQPQPLTFVPSEQHQFSLGQLRFKLHRRDPEFLRRRPRSLQLLLGLGEVAGACLEAPGIDRRPEFQARVLRGKLRD